MNNEWKQRPEGGGLFALWLIRSIGRYGGRAISRVCLYPITLYFLIRRGPERRASRQWLNRALGRPATLWDSAKHIHTFAATILDRVFLLSDSPERMVRRFDVDVSGLDVLHAHLDLGRGMLLFGSHLGSFEVLRVLARKRPEYTIRVVLDKAHNAAVTQLLDALNPDIAATVIDAGQDGPALMLAIQQAVQEGALVALLIDRAHPGGQTILAPFFGAPMALPTAPWLIALAMKAPVTLAFGLYRGGRRYQLRFEHFCDPLDIPRAQRRAALTEMVQRYATRLEDVARTAPYNWFNFYNVWEDVEGHSDAQAEHASVEQTPPERTLPEQTPVRNADRAPAVDSPAVDQLAVDRPAVDKSALDQRALDRHRG